jgi:predicted O-methyltransferase YrrM
LNLSIVNHGWVDKKVLAKFWKSSEIWFYPCKFKETFCLTALEAAASQTFVVSNHLAALQNTVGDRGICVDGSMEDVMKEEWQDKALHVIFEYLLHPEKQIDYLERNYQWALEHSWENQAKKLLSYIEPTMFSNFGNHNQILDCGNLYNWTHDNPEGSKVIFEKILNNFKDKIHSILEIGTFAGISLIGFLKILPNANATVIDIWKNYQDINNMEKMNIESRFDYNIRISGFQNRVTKMKGDSEDKLLELLLQNKKFDFIYVDASHLLCDTYFDCVMAWKLLNKGGLLGIDDYLYDLDKNDFDKPYHAVNRFLEKHKDEYIPENIGYRVFIRKI